MRGYHEAFGWSTREWADAYAIISGYRVGHTKEGNRYRQYALHRILKDYGVSFFKAKGAYEGEIEEVCVVPLHFKNTLDKVRKIARGLDQETILVLSVPSTAPCKDSRFNYTAEKTEYDLSSNAVLEWVESGERLDLGKFTRVDATRISTLEAWTLIDGAVYTCIDETEAAEAA